MEELSIRSVLNEQRIDLHLKGQTKDEVLDEMVDLLFKDSVLSSKEQFLKDVYYREGEGITGIGDGIAIPHGKSDSVLHTAVAIGRSDHDLEWRSIDDKPVRLIIMLAIKSVDKTVHMKLLSNVATSLCQRDVIEQIFISEDKEEIIELFEQKGGKE
ncbi:PTS sugar transporter subunit IIA [Dielma fastidiosa]|uniref:PTS sugar transporter subunit IIA n=1 Tax=Dielma fastidiosa TaxID=1034346 RepID=UPI000EC43D87|nr:PTS sugar transporter subunit IIA [Dielma fastidiosa]HAH94364.1 PTS fructose transporter subunit IIA [Dielma fastidiosa]